MLMVVVGSHDHLDTCFFDNFRQFPHGLHLVFFKEVFCNILIIHNIIFIKENITSIGEKL